MLKLNEIGITTAASRIEILEYVIKGNALYVEQTKGERLNCVGVNDIRIPTEDSERWVEPDSLLKSPLLLDMQTANAMLTVHKALTTDKARENFNILPWVQIAKICWSAIK